VRALKKISQHDTSWQSNILLDFNTAKFFFAAGAHVVDKNKPTGQFLRLWTSLSGENHLPCTENELKGLRQAADHVQLVQLMKLIDSQLRDGAESRSFSLKIRISKGGFPDKPLG
jgi:hypothetical protein